MTDFSGDLITDEIASIGIPSIRHTLDTARNNLGFSMTDFCKSQRLSILNGRAGKDKEEGETTCRGVSTVDYMMAKLSFF